jgi:integrase
MSQPMAESKLEGKHGGEKAKKARKRGQGEGSIYKRKDGRWTAVVNLGYQNGKLNRKYYYGETRDEVKDKLIAALNDHRQGIPVALERQTVEQFLNHWLTDCAQPSVRVTTFVSYEIQIRVHIAPILGYHQLSKLSPQHIQEYLKNKLAAGLSAKTVKYHLSVLRMALGQALRWNLIARNVAMLVDPPRVEKYEVQPITPEQARIFLQAIQGDRLEILFTVALSLGLRRGESLGLRWTDIDFENRTLRVKNSLQRIQGKLTLSEPKTKSSRRILDLPELLNCKLKEHRTRQLEEKLAAGHHWTDTGLVFTTRLGTPVDPRHVKRRLDPLLKKAGLPHYRVHDLRHFCASLLLAQGVPLKVVSEILGHSQINITADLYTHVLPSLRREAFDLMNSIMTGTK